MKLDEIRKDCPEMEYIERSIQPDPIDLVVSFSPKDSIVKVVQNMTSNTARVFFSCSGDDS